MFRWVRRALLVVALVVLVGGGILALTARPDLEGTQDDVEARWDDLRPALDRRYELLAAATAAVVDAGGPERDVVQRLDEALGQWPTNRSASVRAQVDDANELEALGRRLVTLVGGSPSLQAPEVVAATTRFDEAPLPETARAFNTAVREYEDARGGSFRRPIASLLGHDTIAAFDTSTPTTGRQPQP
jgi:hypothetical protein